MQCVIVIQADTVRVALANAQQVLANKTANAKIDKRDEPIEVDDGGQGHEIEEIVDDDIDPLNLPTSDLVWLRDDQVIRCHSDLLALSVVD